MKIKNKGKVYPSPSSSSCSNEIDVFSVLKLLPATIFALASFLSLEDREVLAYMITRSLKTTSATSSSSSLVQESKKKYSKKVAASINSNTHKAPKFDCDCFDCYTSYWFRWDCSSNRELIHQVIEAFEDHLTNGEKYKKNGGRRKRRENMCRQETLKPIDDTQTQPIVPMPTNASPESVVFDVEASVAEVLLLEKNVFPVASLEKSDGFEEIDKIEEEKKAEEEDGEQSEDMGVVVRTANHKGFARKVLPDVLGILNSRLWGLWSPNV